MTGLNENYARIKPYLPELYKKAEPGLTLSGAVSPGAEELQKKIEQMQKDHDLLIAQLQEKNILPIARVVKYTNKKTGQSVEIDQQFQTE